MSCFLDLSPDPLCVTDNSGRLLRINKRWEDSFGALEKKTKEPLLTDDVHPDDKEKTASALSGLGPDCSTSSLINRFRHQKSGYRWTEWRLLFHEGFISASARDINTHIESREELQRFRDVLDSSLNEIYLAHAETFTFSFVSAGALMNLGYSLEEMQAMTPFDINAPDQKKALESLFKRLKGGGCEKVAL